MDRSGSTSFPEGVSSPPSFAAIGQSNDNSLVLLSVDEIRPNPHNPRQEFSDEALQQLAHSIRQWGQLQPVVVRRLPQGGYELICGERRWRAHKYAGIDRILAVVRDVSDQDIISLMLVENLHREDLSHAEKVAALDDLAELTQSRGLRKVAQSLGVDAGWLSRQLAIRRDPVIFPALESGQIGFGQAAELLRAPASDRQKLLDRVLQAPKRVPTATVRQWVEEARREQGLLPRGSRTKNSGCRDTSYGRGANAYWKLVSELETLGVPHSVEECHALMELSRKARQLISASGLHLRHVTVLQKRSRAELDCMMCGETAGVIETKLNVRLSPDARVHRVGTMLTCTRCGGALIYGDRSTSTDTKRKSGLAWPTEQTPAS